MSKRTLPEQYFENKAQQNQIQQVILCAIPTGVYYHNLIIALADLIAGFTNEAFKKDVYTKSVHNDEVQP